MMPDAGEIERLLDHTLARLRDFDVCVAVLFSGHFAGPQVEMVKRLASKWGDGDGGVCVRGHAVSEIDGLHLRPDHAAIFETTLLGELHPNLVDVSRLPAMEDGPMPDSDSWSGDRHNPSHPLYGIMGPDPRRYDPDAAAHLVDTAARWLTSIGRDALNCRIQP
jgi:creatinine amidohydrolase